MSPAAAAAKIQAQIEARAKSTRSENTPAKSPSDVKSPAGNNGEMYMADGDFIKDIEINDLRNRYTLTKGAVQKMVNYPRLLFSLTAPVQKQFFHPLAPVIFL